MDKVFEKAVLDFYNGRQSEILLIHNTYGEPDEMPLDVYFRDKEDLTELETIALERCKGKVLDLGAGMGSLTLILQEKGLTIDALEISPAFCSIMFDRKVKSIIETDFLTAPEIGKYETILMMMNGFGLCGSIDKLPKLFDALNRNLTAEGQVIFDSSDLSYLYDKDLPENKYYGEMDFQYEYNGLKGSWFKWLYIDPERLKVEAAKHGFELEVLFTEDTGQYLGKLVRG